MTGRTLALLVASALVPVLWGWIVPALLVRVWPRRPPPAAERPPFPDYEI